MSRTIAVTLTASVLVAPNTGAECKVKGWTFRETGGTTDLTIQLYTSKAPGGTSPVNPSGAGTDRIVASIDVPKGGSKEFMDHAGFEVNGGLYFKTAGGTCEGALYIS